MKDIYSSRKLYKEYVLYSCNPIISNDFTAIEFEIPERAGIKLAIYDDFGKEIGTLLKEELCEGFYQYKLDCSVYPEGTYILKLSTEKFTDSRKVFIVR